MQLIKTWPVVSKLQPKKTLAPKTATLAETLNNVGLSALCGRIAAGESQKSIADSLGIAANHMCEWIAADPERSARVREARAMSARHWDEQAERAILDADVQTAGSIAQARELASHYRWRASKYAPREYGDKIQQELTGANGGPVELVTAIVINGVKPK